MENNYSQTAQMPHAPWGIRDLVFAALFVIAGIVALNLIAWAIGMVAPEIRQFNSATLAIFVVAQSAIFLGAVYWFGIARYALGWDALGLRGFDTRIGCVWSAGLLIASYAIRMCYVVVVLGFGIRLATQDVLLRFDASVPGIAIAFATAALLAPVVEEIFFRGFVYGGLRGRIGARGANLFSALVFTALHFSLDQFIPILILGVFLAWLYEKTGSLIPSIFLHAANNGLALVAYFILKASGALPG